MHLRRAIIRLMAVGMIMKPLSLNRHDVVDAKAATPLVSAVYADSRKLPG